MRFRDAVLAGFLFVQASQALAVEGVKMVNPLTEAEEKSAFRVAKLFFAARAAVGEKASFTDDPTNPKNDKASLLEAVKLSYDRIAGEPLKSNADPAVAQMWDAIETVIDRAMRGEYKGRWADHHNFPGKLIPARFGYEVTQEFNSKFKSGSVRWTTAENYLVNPQAKADEWEQQVIRSKFQSANWKQGQPYAEKIVDSHGKTTIRYALPEYFKTSCMNCHGGEMGKQIHKGKAAAGTGTFGGILSVQYKK
jgi:hypothetical protein